MKRSLQRAALWCATTVFVASNAFAQTGAEVATRNALLEDATQARRNGNHPLALELAERAGRIAMTPSVRLFIAQEQNQVGQLADALGNAQQCAREAERNPTLPSRTELLETCRALATELAPRVGRILLRTPTPLPNGFRVSIDGTPLSDTFYDVPYVVTPGTLLVEAVAIRHAAFNEQVSVQAGQLREIFVTLQPFDQPNETPRRQEPVIEPPSLVPPIIVLSAGALALGTGGLFYGLRNTQLDQLSGCPAPNRCPDTQNNRDALDGALTYNIATNVFLITGGVVATAGAAWLVINLVRRANTPQRSSSLHLLPTGNGLLVSRSF